MPATRKPIAEDTIQVMIVDDHPTVREGLGHRIGSQADMSVCGEAADVQEALKKVADCRPDVVIVDIALKSSNGMDLVRALSDRHKNVRSLVMSMYDESIYADRCLHAGAMGYINKEANPDEVIAAIRTVNKGEVYLSPAMTSELLGRNVRGGRKKVDPVETLTDRQLEVFRLIGEGKTAAEIARQLHLSAHTVETHRDNIKHKLNVDSIAGLTQRAVLWSSQSR